jgi:hypothetical protein
VCKVTFIDKVFGFFFLFFLCVLPNMTKRRLYNDEIMVSILDIINENISDLDLVIMIMK